MAKPLYDCTISYMTPSGSKVLYGKMLAGSDMQELETELRRILAWHSKPDRWLGQGARRVASVCDDFKATYVGMQIATK